jgi:hypothetical protein
MHQRHGFRRRFDLPFPRRDLASEWTTLLRRYYRKVAAKGGNRWPENVSGMS